MSRTSPAHSLLLQLLISYKKYYSISNFFFTSDLSVAIINIKVCKELMLNGYTSNLISLSGTKSDQIKFTF